MAEWRRSAAYRIALLNFAAWAVWLAILGLVIFAAMHIAFTRQLDSMLADEAGTLVEEYRSGGTQELGESIAERESARSSSPMLYAVFARDGRRLHGSLRTARPPLGIHDIKVADSGESVDRLRVLALDLSSRERLVVAAEREWTERVDRTIIAVFGVGFLIACVLGLGGAAILGGYLRGRMQSITGTADAIIQGDIRKRMPVSARHDEFDQMAATLNRMLDRIEGLVDNLRQVSSDIAHDLRTPLASLRTQLEQGLISSRGGVDAPVLEDAIRRVDEVLSLFAAILRIAEVEGGQTRRFFELVDLGTLTTELAESYAPAFEDAGLSLLWSIQPGVTVEGDRELLAQAVINLLDNAQRHTPAGTVVRLTLVAAGRHARIQVADNGPGVPSADLHRITRRFARLERSRSTPGHGLGLSLVSAVAALHRGRLLLQQLEPGLSATIELPIDPAGTWRPGAEQRDGAIE